MRRQTQRQDILARLCQAEEGKDWLEVSDILDEASSENIQVLKPELPRLMEHRDWVIRASAVERVGAFELIEFVRQVRARLKDRNVHVRSYALMAYYDLLGEKALPVIREHCQDSSVHVRVTALALCYVASEDEAVLRSLERIVLRRNCHYRHRGAMLNILDHYLDIPTYPELIDLFKAILQVAPKWHGVSKDIARKLRTGFAG